MDPHSPWNPHRSSPFSDCSAGGAPPPPPHIPATSASGLSEEDLENLKLLDLSPLDFDLAPDQQQSRQLAQELQELCREQLDDIDDGGQQQQQQPFPHREQQQSDLVYGHQQSPPQMIAGNASSTGMEFSGGQQVQIPMLLEGSPGAGSVLSDASTTPTATFQQMAPGNNGNKITVSYTRYNANFYFPIKTMVEFKMLHTSFPWGTYVRVRTLGKLGSEK